MRILIICEYIAPLHAVASIRWTKIAKYIKKHHPECDITILTNQKLFQGISKKDTLLEKDMMYFEYYIEFPNGLLAGIYEHMKQAGGKKIRHYVISNKYNQSKSFSTNIKKALFSAVHDLKDYGLYQNAKKKIKALPCDYDVIISSFGPAWPHRLAAYLKKKHKHLRWIADFRDCYAGIKDDPVSFWMHKRFTMKYCASADQILQVVKGLETYTPTYIPTIVLPNGFDPDERLCPKAFEKFSIVFTGLLYGEMRDIGIVCKVLRELCEEKKMNREDVEVSYAGPDGMLAAELAGRYAAEDYLRDHGICPRQHALAMQRRAAILLQLNWNTEHEKCGWSGKMYEYMMAEKPIIYIVTGDVPYSEPSRKIHHLGGCCYEQCRHEETYPQMKAYILEKYQEWKETGNVSVQQDKEYIEQYSYSHIAEQVWQLIQSQEERRKSDESTTA